MKYSGGCHCGDVRFEVEADFEKEVILDCNCTICTKKGFLHLIVKPESFRMLTPKENMTTYTFGTHTAKHTFCTRCGIYAFYEPRSHPGQIDVNVRCIDGVDCKSLKIEPFEGRSWSL